MKPADTVIRWSKTCPQCAAHPSKKRRCKCCGGSGRIIDAVNATEMLAEELENYQDDIFHIKSVVEEIGAVRAKGGRPRIVSVEDDEA
jgi:hypothetical protein